MQSAPAGQYLGCEQGIHGAGTEAFEVESDELEAQGFEDAGEFSSHLRTQRTRQLFAGNLDTHNVPVVTDPELAEAERADRVFALFDNSESFARNLASVLDAGGEASGSGLVPNTQTCAAG